MARIFLSSPSDVKPERTAVARVVAAVNAQLPPTLQFELVDWEHSYYTAVSPFQDQIVRSSDCDLVICIFWKRMGSPLPEKYRRPDGSLPTGSEYEFEEALRKATSSNPRTPDVLVYRKTAKVLFSEDNLEAEQAQRERLLSFWRHWFHTESGHFTAGFHDFEDTRAFEALIATHLAQWAENHSPSGSWQGGSPFRGLKAFDVDDAPLFFGRAREMDRARARLIANALKGCRFLLIQGPSGSGKSSVARAGLLAQLKAPSDAAGIPALNTHLSVTPTFLRHGVGRWEDGLAEALLDHARLGPAIAAGDFKTKKALSGLIASGGTAARPGLEGALQRMGDSGLCLLIDQLEELLQWPKGDRDAFGAFLAKLTQSARIFVIATMRSEYAGALMETPAFRSLVKAAGVAGPDLPMPVIDIRPPAPGDLQQIITGPAQLADLHFEGATTTLPDLATRVETETPTADLPALQYLLTQLYEMREGNMLTHAAYDQLGGVSGVLAARGNAVLESQPGNASKAFARIVRQLVDVSAPDRPATARSAPETAFEADKEAASLINALCDAGLMKRERGMLRLAHETLLGKWDRLAEQLTAERRLFIIRTVVSLAYDRFLDQQGEHKTRGLLQGLALAEAQDLLSSWGLSAVEAVRPGIVAFISASTTADRRRRRLRAGLQVAAAAAVAGAVIGGLWLDARRNTAQLEAQAQANIAEITQLALLNRDWDRAAASLARLKDPAQTAQTRSLAFAVTSERPGPALLSQTSKNVVGVAAMPGGGFATLSSDGLLNKGDIKVTLPALDRFGARYFHLHVRPDNSTIILASDGHVSLVSPDGASVTPLLDETRYLSTAASFDILDTPDGFLIALADAGGPGIILECGASGKDCRKTELPSFQTGVGFLADGERIAYARGKDVSIAPLSDTLGKRPYRKYDANVLSLIRSKGTLIAGLADGGFVDLETGQSTMSPGTGAITQSAGNSAGALAYTCGRGRLCHVSNLQSAARVLSPLNADPVSLAWDKKEAQLATALTDGTLQVWDTEFAARKVWALQEGPISIGRSMASTQGMIALATETKVIILDQRDGRIEVAIDALDAPVTDMATGPKGQIAVALENGSIWRRDQKEQPAERTKLGVRIERLAWDGGTLFGTSGRGIMQWPPGSEPVHAFEESLGSRSSIGGLIPVDGALVYSRSDGALMAWGASGSAPLIPEGESADALAAMRLALDLTGRYLATTRAQDHVRIYDLETGKALALSDPAQTGSTDVAFSPDGLSLAVLDADDTVALWKLQPGSELAELYARYQPIPETLRDAAPSRQVSSIDWLTNSELIVTTSAGFVIQTDVTWEAISNAFKIELPITVEN